MVVISGVFIVVYVGWLGLFIEIDMCIVVVVVVEVKVW